MFCACILNGVFFHLCHLNGFCHGEVLSRSSPFVWSLDVNLHRYCCSCMPLTMSFPNVFLQHFCLNTPFCTQKCILRASKPNFSGNLVAFPDLFFSSAFWEIFFILQNHGKTCSRKPSYPQKSAFFM